MAIVSIPTSASRQALHTGKDEISSKGLGFGTSGRLLVNIFSLSGAMAQFCLFMTLLLLLNFVCIRFLYDALKPPTHMQACPCHKLQAEYPQAQL